MVFPATLALMFIINPIAATGYLRFSEISLATAFGIILLGTYLNMIVVYFGLGGIVSVFAKKLFARALRLMQLKPLRVRPNSKHQNFCKHGKFFSQLKAKRNSLTNWLIRRHLVVICALFVLGPLPYLPSLLVVIIRMKRIGAMQKASILGTINLLRALLIVFAMYYFPILFLWQK